MIPAAVFFLLAGSAQTVLVDEPFTVPAAEWRFLDVVLKQTPLKLECVYGAKTGVRVAVISERELERFRSGNRPPGLAARPFQTSGRLEERISAPGRYAVVIENSRNPGISAQVRLKVTLDFLQQVGYVPPGRKLAVILISFAAFFAIVTYSARRLLRAIR